MRFSSVCTFSCPDGFTTDVTAPQTVSRSLTCQLNGEWDAQAPQCHDYRSPTLSCPGPIIIGHTTKGKATGKVSWNIQVTDNSVIVDPNAKITVTSTHQSSQQFPIGATDVQVTASDSTGNTATCSFSVRIEDIEPPIIKQCPGDIVREEEKPEVRVHWTRPVFSDNSGSVTLSSNRQIGELFAVPGTYQIVYTANDPSNNENKNCSFRITLKKKTCPLYPPPRNGALACVSKGGDDTCAVMCQTGTDFEFSVPLLYFCSAGQWSFYSLPGASYDSTLPWPNCTAGVNPSSSIKLWSQQYHYFDGDAHDLNIQASIKDKFYQLLTSPYVPPFFCLFDPECLKNIFVSPGIKG
ncbi:sushi, von Willebrand factor type A, EGF and pentraxin domain-containing protein 1-like [Porites lutea]|uniref:sushi, von Willebrand factor type A, EGF and pentraxin domain-containing protein 1-like n=1 Tax=Porites lutea TaxID=51062 RepID=UPI003CC6622A